MSVSHERNIELLKQLQLHYYEVGVAHLQMAQLHADEPADFGDYNVMVAHHRTMAGQAFGRGDEYETMAKRCIDKKFGMKKEFKWKKD